MSGVTKSIASRVLNNDPTLRARPETRERVLEAARKLGYRPHAGARALSVARTGTLAFLIPDLMNSVYVAILRGAMRRVITSYSIHYTKLYDIADLRVDADFDPAERWGSLAATVQVTHGAKPRPGLLVRTHVIDPRTGTELASGTVPVPHDHARPYEFEGFVATWRARSLAVAAWSAEEPRLYECRVHLVDADGTSYNFV